jgi:hypothetical protein
MQILVVLGLYVWELWGVPFLDFAFKTYMAYNNLPCTTVQACDVERSACVVTFVGFEVFFICVIARNTILTSFLFSENALSISGINWRHDYVNQTHFKQTLSIK